MHLLFSLMWNQTVGKTLSKVSHSEARKLKKKTNLKCFTDFPISLKSIRDKKKKTGIICSRSP